MMRIAILSAGFVLTTIFVSAQEKITAIVSPNGPVVEHTVTTGETLYGVARKYNIKVADLAKANDFDIQRGLRIGEVVKVPLSENNFTQKGKKGIAVYYNTSDGEGLLSVSKKFNKVPVKTLRELNGMKTDVIQKGQSLMVGYLTGASIQSSKADDKATAKKEEKPGTKKQEKPAPKKEVAKENETGKEAKSKTEDKKPEQIAEEKIVAKQETEQPAKIQTAEPADESGYFTKQFEQTSNPSLLTHRTLMSGIFKTDAGWKDYKYYMLLDAVAPGTIVKLTNPQNGKMVYAKVLGNMKEVKYSENLNMRISEAAAKALQITDMDMFVLTASY